MKNNEISLTHSDQLYISLHSNSMGIHTSVTYGHNLHFRGMNKSNDQNECLIYPTLQSKMLYLLIVSHHACHCMCRETTLLPGCTIRGPCFWAQGPNFWKKTWPSWTGSREDLQGGRRRPQSQWLPATSWARVRGARRCPAMWSSDTSCQAAGSKRLPVWEWRRRREGLPGVMWSETLIQLQPVLGTRERLVKDHWKLRALPCLHQLYIIMHICFRHLCLI